MVFRYVAVHQSLKGPGDARPTAQAIIDDEKLQGKLEDKTILITGCSGGLGAETARDLYTTGATLYLTVRDLEKAEKNLADIARNPRVHFLQLDLNSLESVRACTEEFKAKSTALNILIGNAGVMACPEGRTADGFETQFGSNYLAHFLLFALLKPVLLTSATPEFHSRVVLVSSAAHRFSSVDFDNLNFEGKYDPAKAYGQSKTAMIWFANEIERRFGSQKLHAFSLHPGGVATDLGRHIPDEQKAVWAKDPYLAIYFKNPQQGAATTVLGAVSTELEGQGGKYLENCGVAGPYDPASGMWGPGYAEWAFDTEAEQKLWAKSVELVGLQE